MTQFSYHRGTQSMSNWIKCRTNMVISNFYWNKNQKWSIINQWTIKKYINKSINRHNQAQWHTRVYWQTNTDIPAEKNWQSYLSLNNIYIYKYSNYYMKYKYSKIYVEKYGAFTISKNGFDGQCTGQKNQKLLINRYIHKRIKIPHIKK